MSETNNGMPEKEMEDFPPPAPPHADIDSMEARLGELTPPPGADHATWHELYQTVLRIVRESA